MVAKIIESRELWASGNCLLPLAQSSYLPTFAPMKQQVFFRDMGTVDYQTSWDLQEQLLKKNVDVKAAAKNLFPETAKADSAVNTLHYFLMVEHPPVYTLGKSGLADHVLISEADREQKGIAFFRTNRGGDITFHGPGQLVGYPIFDLEKFYTDIGLYLRNIEEVIIRTLAEYGIHGERSKGETGVWIDPLVPGCERKICAIGVRCSRWITMHGFAFNVNTDLSYFDHIVPCGIRGKQVTSLQRELGRKTDLAEIKPKLLQHVEQVFNVEIREEGQ